MKLFFTQLTPIEPHRDKTSKMACAPSEDSDQPGHSPSLIRVFTVRMKKAKILSYPLSAQRRLRSAWASAKTLIRLGGCPGWSESSLGAHAILLNRVFAVRMKKAKILSYPLSAQRRLRSAWASAKTLIRLGGCPGWSESSLGAHAILLVFSRCGSIISRCHVMHTQSWKSKVTVSFCLLMS